MTMMPNDIDSENHYQIDVFQKENNFMKMFVGLIVFSLICVSPVYVHSGDGEIEADREGEGHLDSYLRQSVETYRSKSVERYRSKHATHRLRSDGRTELSLQPLLGIPAHLSLDRLDFNTRGRIKTNGEGARDDQKVMQARLRFGASLHVLDRLSVHVGGRTGDKTTSGFNQISGGKNQQMHFNIRRFYVNLNPVEGVQFTVGSFGPYTGLGSDRTLIDKDAYLTGYRLQLNLKESLEKSLGQYIEKVTLESSYFGDETKENVFGRLDRLGDNNNNMVMLESAEFMGQFKIGVGVQRFNHRDFVPLQGKWRLDTMVIKEIVAQTQLEMGRDRAHATSVHAISEPVENLRIRVGATFVSDDFDFPNNDAYPAGERFDLQVIYFLPYGFSVGAFYADGFEDFTDFEDIRAEVAVQWDALRLLDYLNEDDEEDD